MTEDPRVRAVTRATGPRVREAIRATVTEDLKVREAIRATGPRVREAIRATGHKAREAIRATGHKAREATRVTGPRARAAIRATVTAVTEITAEQDHRDHVQAEMLRGRQVPLILLFRQSLPATELLRMLIKTTDSIREIKMTRQRKEHRPKAESR